MKEHARLKECVVVDSGCMPLEQCGVDGLGRRGSADNHDGKKEEVNRWMWVVGRSGGGWRMMVASGGAMGRLGGVGGDGGQ